MVYWIESEPSLRAHQESPPQRGAFSELTEFIAGFEKPFLEILNLLIITKLESIDRDRTHRKRSDIVMQHFVKSLKDTIVKKVEELALEVTDDVRVQEIFSNLRISLNEMTQAILGPSEFNKSMLLTLGQMCDQEIQTELPLPPLSRRSSRNFSTSTEKKNRQLLFKDNEAIQIHDVSMETTNPNASQSQKRREKLNQSANDS